MRICKKSVTAGFAAVGLALGLASVNTAPAVAAAEPPACVAELRLEVPSVAEAENKHPVLAVHGWGGDKDTWSKGNPSMIDAVSSTHEAVPVKPFEYPTDQWVTDPQIGHKLAKTIVCYSKLYKHKLILLAHSMGGLAAREALDWADSGTWARDVTGHAITIGSPHLGALPANLESEFWVSVCKAPAWMLSPGLSWMADGPCRDWLAARATAGMSIGSDQLDKLAYFPPGVSVKAIAGEVSHRKCPIWGVDWGCDRTTTASDLVVGVGSATAESTDTGKGDGTTVFKCDADAPVAKVTTAWCEHSNMLQAPQVQDEVKKSIQDYIASTTYDDKPKLTLYGLQLPQDSGWQVVQDQYGEFTNESRTTLTKDCPNAAAYPPGCSEAIVVVNLNGPENMDPYGGPAPVGDPDCYSDKIHEDAAFGSPKLVETVDIGGEQATHQVLTGCDMFGGGTPGSPNGDEMHVWRIPQRSVLVYASYTADISAVEKLLGQASWQ